MKNVLTLLIVLITLAASGQQRYKGTLVENDKTSYTGSFTIDQEAKAVTIKTKDAERTIPFASINTLTTDALAFKTMTINDQEYFVANTETMGNNYQLLELNPGVYALKNGDQSQILDTKNDSKRINGQLAVLLSDCNTIRSTLNTTTRWNKSKLTAILNSYANCEKSDYAPTDSEIANANKDRTDIAQFFVGVGGSALSHDINGFETDGALAGQFRFGVIASPSFLKSLKRNLYFTVEGEVNFAPDKDFNTPESTVSFRQNSYRILGGIEYQFLKDQTYRPYLGVKAGFTKDDFKGVKNEFSFNIDGGSPIVVPSLGLRKTLDGGAAWGLHVSYIFEYDNDLRFPNGQDIELLDVTTTAINFGLTYYFK